MYKDTGSHEDLKTGICIGREAVSHEDLRTGIFPERQGVMRT
jgi:hypothetical protein